jgi:hypothetical protein
MCIAQRDTNPAIARLHLKWRVTKVTPAPTRSRRVLKRARVDRIDFDMGLPIEEVGEVRKLNREVDG